MSTSRAISEGSFAVHGITSRPHWCVSSSRAAGELPPVGDQTAAPAARPARNEPPKSRNVQPPSQGRVLSSRADVVVEAALGGEGQTIAMS